MPFGTGGEFTGGGGGGGGGPATPTGPAGGDLSGTYPNPTVAKINTTPLGTLTGASTNQALIWNGSAWVPATVIIPGSTAGGDLSGTYPNPTVAKINGTALGTLSGASTGQVLEWNGSAWVPVSLPTSVPALSAMDAFGHSYLSGGTAVPTAQQIGLMSRLLGAFHVAETNFTPTVAGGATILVPAGQSQAGWDAFFNRRLSPTTIGYIASTGGSTGQPAVQWPLTNGPLLVVVQGFNDLAFGFQPYGIFQTAALGVAGVGNTITGIWNSTSLSFYILTTNVTTGGTYLPNRVGGNGVQVGDFLSGTGIRGYAPVSSVAAPSANGSTTITAATNSGTTITCTAAGTWVTGTGVFISGGTGGTWSTTMNGAWIISSGGSGSFQVVVNVAPTGSYTGSTATAQGASVMVLPSAQVTGAPTTVNVIPSRSTSGQAVTGLQNAFQGVIERALAGAVVVSSFTSGTDTKFAYGGGTNAWAAVNCQNNEIAYPGFVGGTGPTQQITYANNDTFTFTIDPKFPGGVVALVMTGPVTSDLDNSGASVAWSGTASAATGSTTIAGQGWVGQPVPVVKRFVLTGADAGKTIIGTFNNGTPCNYVVSSITNGTTAVTTASGNWPLTITPGMGVSGTNIAAGTYVQSVAANSNQMILSQAASGSGTQNLTFTSTVLQVDHASYEATYMNPVLIANQPVNGPGGIWSPNCTAVLDKAITQAIATFTGTSPQTVCGVTNNYNTIGKADMVAYFAKRSFWLGTSLGFASGLTVTYDTSSKNDGNIILIGQRTTGQGDQIAPFPGQYVTIPPATEGDVNEVCLISSVVGGAPVAPVTVTNATNVSTDVTCTASGTYTVGQVVTIAGASGGTFSNINGSWVVTTGGSGSFHVTVGVAPTGSYSASSATVAQNQVTITGGTPTAGTYPAWGLTLARGLRSFGNASTFITGNTNYCAAATGSTTAPTQGVYDCSWTQPIDYVHPGIGGSGLWASVFEQAYQTFANQTADWVGTGNQSWAFGRTRTAPVPLNGGYWSRNGTFGAGATTTINGFVWAQRFVTPVPIIVDQISVDVTTANASEVFSAGFLTAAQGGSGPGNTVLFDFGLQNKTMGSLGTLTTNGWQLVPPGEYWVAVAFAGGAAAHVECGSAFNDDMPQWRNAFPAVGTSLLGYNATVTSSAGLVTSLAPNSAWSAVTATFPWIIVHAYQHTYLVGS